MDDKTLRGNILAALDWDPSINATEIGVTVDKGVVTLTGHVQTYPERFTAEKIVKHVRGVRAVAQEIEVGPRFTRTWADDDGSKGQALEVPFTCPWIQWKKFTYHGRGRVDSAEARPTIVRRCSPDP